MAIIQPIVNFLVLQNLKVHCHDHKISLHYILSHKS